MPEAVDMINLGFLSESERELILEVLQRDEKLRQAEDQRVRKLKTELQDVKRKGAKRASEKYSQHSCGRCLEPLSRLTVFSSQCKMCNHIVCRNCRMVLPDGSWLCNVCFQVTQCQSAVCLLGCSYMSGTSMIYEHFCVTWISQRTASGRF
uniref:RabBD domain-containing protein n=1 Tax=Neolamprologus brichardi TaxID=32507 RepID=A0A3Q4HWA7_NEOBR